MTSREALQLAVDHHRRGLLQQAAEFYRQSLQLEPENPDALHLTGVLYAQTDRRDEGIAMISHAVARAPAVVEYRLSLITTLHDVGRFADAIEHCVAALVVDPHRMELHLALAESYQLAGRALEAIGEYERALSGTPGDAFVLFRLGQAHTQLSQPAQASDAYRRSIQLNPTFAPAYTQLAHAQLDLGDHAGAIASLTKASELDPADPVAMNDLAVVLKEVGRLDESIDHYRRALALAPQASEIHNNLGNALKEQGRSDEAAASIREAIRLEPRNVVAHSNLLFTLHLSSHATPDAIANEHREWASLHAEPLTRLAPAPSRSAARHGRIRIGYVSPDFREHPVGRFFLPLLANHDPSEFDVICYANLPTNADAISKQIEARATTWRDVTPLNDDELANLLRDDKIDILVDLAGHSAGNRLLTFARRPAPVQLSFLGYPDTTGMSAIGHRLTDAIADPVGQTDALHTEKLIRLPICAWCFEPPREAPEVKRQSRDNFTFGSFNSLSKINDALLTLWARILVAEPDARLLIKGSGLDGPKTRERILHVLERAGVAAHRIELVPHTAGYIEHLAAYDRIDVALDAYPYNGTMTTCEALWMRVPVVTLAGQTHVSRTGASLLTTVGLTELIAETSEQYVELALSLAQDRDRLSSIATTLRDRMHASPLMNAGRYASEVEAAYRSLL